MRASIFASVLKKMNPDEKQQELIIAQEALQKSFNYLASTFGINDPTSEFELLDYIKDDLEMRHFRLQQVYEGLRVFGHHLVVHLTKDVEVRDTTGEYRIINTKVEPKITSNQAIEIAKKIVTGESRGNIETELIIYPDKNSSKSFLTFLVTIPVWQDGLPKRFRCFVDANTGEILYNYNDQSVTGPATSTHGIFKQLSKK